DCSVISLKQNRSVPRELRTRHNIPGNINRFIEIATGVIRRRRDDNEGSRRRLMACRESYCPTCAHHRPMSAFGGKADMAIALRNVRFLPEADIRADMNYSVGARLMASRRRARSNTRWALR